MRNDDLAYSANSDLSSTACEIANLKKRYLVHWQLCDLEEIIFLQQNALAALEARLTDSPDVDPTVSVTETSMEKDSARAEYCLQLAEALGDRYQHTSDINDVQRQVDLCYQALQQTSISHSLHRKAIALLGAALRTRFQRDSVAEDLDEAIRVHQLLSESSSPFDTAQLGRTLAVKAVKDGSLEGLSTAIDLGEKAVSACPLNGLFRPICLEYLAEGLLSRYQVQGALEDNDRYRELYLEALNIRGPGHRDRHIALNGLGNALGARFERTGDIAQLEASISFHREALSLRPLGHPQHGNSVYNLGHTLRLRFTQLGNPLDLDEAIQLNREALSLFPPGHPLRSYPLGNLGSSLKIRYLLKGDVSDLEDAVAFKRAALCLERAKKESAISESP
jgi:hypothetical protein